MPDTKETKIPLEETVHRDEEDTNERSPLNKDKDVEENGGHADAERKPSTSGGGSATGNGTGKPFVITDRIRELRVLINSNPRYRKAAIIIGGGWIFLLVLTIFIVGIVLFGSDSLKDPQFRYLGLVPSNNSPKNTIKYTAGENGNWGDLKRQMDRFLNDYNNTRLIVEQKTKNLKMRCNEQDKSDANSSCYFNAEEMFSLCQKRENYGLADGSPCIFIKFNNVEGWEPIPINDPKELELPEHLVNYWASGFRGPYVDCVPNTPVDRENMGGELKFAPQSQELPFIYFPYLNQDNYMTPFIAIKFNKPNRNVYVGITCRLWSANLTDSNIGTPEEPSAVLPLHLYIE